MREKECITQNSMPLEKAVDWEKDIQAGETKISGVILKYPHYTSYCKVVLLLVFWRNQIQQLTPCVKRLLDLENASFSFEEFKKK